MEMRVELCPTPHVHRSGMPSWGGVEEKMSDCVPPERAKPSPEGTIRSLLLAWLQELLPGGSRGSVHTAAGSGLCARGNLQQWVPCPGLLWGHAAHVAEAAEQGRSRVSAHLFSPGQCTPQAPVGCSSQQRGDHQAVSPASHT